MSPTPFVGSTSSPREALLRDSATEFTVKSRHRRSSWIVAGSIVGRAPDFANRSVRAMAISTTNAIYRVDVGIKGLTLE